MSRPILDALGQLFRAVPDVSSARWVPPSVNIFQPHNADLVVQTWMGKRLHIYLIYKEPKLRDLRVILRDNTRAGIGTLFLAHHDLVPEPQQDHKPVDWHEALMLLYGGWLYSYALEEASGFTLRQIHFTPQGRGEIYTVWHMNDFAVENVAARHRDVSSGIKGRWYVGDITSPAYKRRVNHERTQQRFHYRTKYRAEVPRQRQRTPPDRLAACYQLLQVAASADQKEIKQAYRRMVLQLHPDVSALPKSESERRFKQVTRAYQIIKEHHGWH